MRLETVCLCGGGSLTHAVAAVLGAAGVNVRVLTRRPALWNETITLLYRDDIALLGPVGRISDRAADVVPGCDAVILTVPFFARPATLRAVKPFLPAHAWVGTFPGTGGFFWLARYELGERARLFATDRVPFVRLAGVYGRSVRVTGIRRRLWLSVLPRGEAGALGAALEEVLHIPMSIAATSLAAMLTPTNPILNPPRLYSIFRDAARQPLQSVPEFYADWDEGASLLFAACDSELQALCASLPMDLSDVKPIFEHYEVSTVHELGARIRSLRTLAGRPAPVKRTSGGWEPDLESSYFAEDIPYGLLSVRAAAELCGVPTPTMDRIIAWYESLSGRRFLVGGRSTGPDTAELPLPQRLGVTTQDALIAQAVA
jgi:opine dehydrogenase